MIGGDLLLTYVCYGANVNRLFSQADIGRSGSVPKEAVLGFGTWYY